MDEPLKRSPRNRDARKVVKPAFKPRVGHRATDPYFAAKAATYLTSRQEIAIIPARVASDRTLTRADLAVLMGLGMFSNRMGVCWPSIPTLAEASGFTTSGVFNSLKTLMRKKLIRRLKPREDRQTAGEWGMSNRWQILYREDLELPGHEVIYEANVLQHPRDRLKSRNIDVNSNETLGGLEGARPPAMYTQAVHNPHNAKQIAACWARGVEARWGIRPDTARAERDAARLLAERSMEGIKEDVAVYLDTLIAARAGLPATLLPGL